MFHDGKGSMAWVTAMRKCTELSAVCKSGGAECMIRLLAPALALALALALAVCCAVLCCAVLCCAVLLMTERNKSGARFQARPLVWAFGRSVVSPVALVRGRDRVRYLFYLILGVTWLGPRTLPWVGSMTCLEVLLRMS